MLRARLRRVFIVNLDRVPGDRAATGAIAAKVLGSQDRYVWYLQRYDVVVLAQAPPADFLEYVASFGLDIEVIVPETINIAAIDMCDSFLDPRLRSIIRGAEVDSYVPDERLARLVETAGGTYLPCASDEATLRVGDKHRLGSLSNSHPYTIPGNVHTGLARVADAVYERLSQGRDTYVRVSSRSGGGLGNFGFLATQFPDCTLGHIISILTARHPDQWNPATVALVEDYITFKSTFGVAFNTEAGLSHTTLQIGRDGSFYGCWIPCPDHILAAGFVRRFVQQYRHLLPAHDYRGDAQVDLGRSHTGTLYRIELNARLSGGVHVEIIRLLMEAEVAKALDVFHLSRRLNFSEVMEDLQRHDLLAKPGRAGVVVSLPPNPHTQAMGIVVVGQSYEEVHGIYQQVAALFGDTAKNTEDHPLFALS